MSDDLYPELVGVVHWTVTGWFTEPPADGIMGHHVVNADGLPGDAAYDCPDCAPRFATFLRGEHVDGWPPKGVQPPPEPPNLFPEDWPRPKDDLPF